MKKSENNNNLIYNWENRNVNDNVEMTVNRKVMLWPLIQSFKSQSKRGKSRAASRVKSRMKRARGSTKLSDSFVSRATTAPQVQFNINRGMRLRWHDSSLALLSCQILSQFYIEEKKKSKPNQENQSHSLVLFLIFLSSSQ